MPTTAPLCRPIPHALPQAATPATVSSSELLSPQGALRIDHKGAIYTLRATSKGGLILTK
jgi:hemin uptake protein HemP